MGDEQATTRLGRAVGKYTLERVIGSGGMATVYEASHRNGHRVAVKMLRPALAVGAEVRARFLREGYAANKVGHPGAVRVLDDDVTDDGLVFLVMELLEGWTLDALAKEHDGKLPVKLVLEIGKQLLEVSRAAHEAGIIHRDIKPENVFLQTTGKLKVLDFGVARIQSPRDGNTTTTGRMLGTPAFMPPEQAYGRRAEVDARSDLWSVGATLFTMMSGRVVHRADTAEETLIKAATEPAPSLARVVEGVPECVAAVVDRALMAEKAARWQSAAEMLVALSAAYERAFATPTPAVVDVRALSAAGISLDAPAVALPTNRGPILPTWGVLALVVGALAAGTAIIMGFPVQGPTTSVASEAAPLADTPVAPLGPIAPTVTPAPPNPTQASTEPPARPARADANPPARAAAARAPAALASASAPASRYCGFEFDEEGRKWPKRCP